MNKKLTTILLAVLLLLIGKVDAATLTQYVGENYIQQTVKEGQQVRLRFINQANYTFTNWTVESGNVDIDTTNPTVSFTMPNSDVVIRGNYSEEVATPQNYTITYNANGGSGTMSAQTVEEGQSVNLTTNTFTYDGYTFLGWSTSSSTTSAIYTDGQNITPTADMTLYAVWEQQGTLLSDVATVGAYVTYVPSSTSYTVPTTVSGYTSVQNFNPSSTTSWRVFSNDEGNVEIISTDSIGTLYLNGRIGYANSVQTLNDMSAAYVNSEYATSGRSLGYYDEKVVASNGTLGDDMTETQKVNYKVVNTSLYPLNYNVSGTPYGDYQYYSDKTILANHGSMYHSSGEVWLASRRVSTFNGDTINDTSFKVNYLNSSGVVNPTSALYTKDSDGSGGNGSKGCGVRPVVSLKSGLTVTGSGISSDPYVINESNPYQYTVTYNANGGYGEMVPQSVSQGSNLTLTANAYAHHSKAFKGWSTSATATTATYTDGQSITPTADMTLYAVWQDSSKLIANKVSVGDYITYTPSNTSYTVITTASGYTSDQTYTPSNTTSWRVLSNDGTNVEIISADSVGTLYLRGATGYTNAVQTLNDMSAAYVNSTYATSGRSLGYYDVTRYKSESNSGSAMTETELANYKTISTSLSYGLSGFPYTDYQYIPDKTALANHGRMYHSTDYSGYVWLASRKVETDGDNAYFKMRVMNSIGNISHGFLYGVYDDGSTYSDNTSCDVRPVVSLKSSLTVTGGSGTSDDPYIISAQ